MTEVQKAWQRAQSLLIKLRTAGCCDSVDPMFLAAIWIIRGQNNQVLHGWAHKLMATLIGDLLLGPDRDPVGRLKKTIDALTQMDSCQRVLIAYSKVIELRGRLPYLRELQVEVASQLRRKIDNKGVPSLRTIRFILDQLKLPRNKRGQPKKKPQ